MRGMPEKKTVILSIRVEDELAEALKALADADERKMSPYIARVLRRHVETERGALGEIKTKKRG